MPVKFVSFSTMHA